MSVFKNKQRGGAWSYEFVLGGKRHRGYCRDEDNKPSPNRTAALQAETRAKAAALAGRRSGPAARAGEYTFAQAAAAHLKRIAERSRHPRHMANHRTYVAEILRFFGGGLAFRDLDQERADEYLAFSRAQTTKTWLGGPRKRGATPADQPQLRDRGRRRSPTQVNNYLKCLRRLLAIADKVRDPVTGASALKSAITLEAERAPRRKPRPMPDKELRQRLAVVQPWTRDALELSRLFGLRLTEALSLQLRHVRVDQRGLFFPAGDNKSGQDEWAFGGVDGWRLVRRLERQARARGTLHLVTWPSRKYCEIWRLGRKIPADVWQPLKSLGRSWRLSARRAGLEDPHRFHDVRARYITEVAKVDRAAAKGAARHQDPATTDLYVGVADSEVSRAVARAVLRRPKGGGRPKLRAVG